MGDALRELNYTRLVRRNTVDLTGAPDKWEHTYKVMLHQAPIPKPGPTFMAWIANGVLHRRTVNKASQKINQFRQDAKAALMTNTPELLQNDFPIYMDNEPVEIDIKFYRRVPDCAFHGSDRNRPRQPLELTCPYDAKRPDIDNLCKFVLDALTGVVYSDDAQIVKLTTTKLVDHVHPYNGRVEISFKCYDKKIYYL